MAENFLTAHSIIREKNTDEYNLNNKVNSTINIDEKKYSGKTQIRKKSGHGEVFYNFDKKKFVGKLNGFTKLLIALGTLNSPFDNFYSNYTDEKNILHYIYITPTVRTSNQLMSNNIFEDKNDNQFDFNLNNLVIGDSFLLESKFIESQQTEILSTKINRIEKFFTSGKIVFGKNNKFLPPLSSVKNFENFDEFSESTENIIKLNDEKKEENNNKIKFVTDIKMKNNFNENDFNNDDKNKKVASVCVRFAGHIRGTWPTVQVCKFKIKNKKIRLYDFFLLFLLIIFVTLFPFFPMLSHRHYLSSILLLRAIFYYFII